MKKLILSFVIFCLISTVFGDAMNGNKMVPSFMWIDGHSSSPQNIPYLNVKFPDRKWDDFVVFESSESYENGNCKLTGHLFHERTVMVEMTKGCPNSDSFEIFFNSSRLSLTSFKVIQGKSKAILQKVSREQYRKIAAESNFGSSNRPPIRFPEGGFVLTLKAFYDQSFKRRFDIASEFIIQKIVEKSQNIFILPSLITTVKLELQETSEIPTTIFSSLDNLKEVAESFTSDISVNTFVFFSDEHFDDDENKESQGIAFIGNMCSSNHKDRVAIVEWTNSLSYTSSTLAHEIGHLLGMHHDFIHDATKKQKFDRWNALYKSCTDIGGVMDYVEDRKLWSTCSVVDFLTYYSNVTNDQRGNFCLKRSQPSPVYSKVLVALGATPGGDTADVEIIDLLSSETTCQKPQNFPYANYFASGGLEFQDKPLICGGYFNRSACHLYEDGVWKSSDSLKLGRYGFAMTKYPFQEGSSKLFLTGGYDGSSYLNSSEVLTENGWQVSVPLPVTLSDHCMVKVNSTSVMVIGGFQNGKFSGRSFLFNSETNIWTEGPTLNIARDLHSCGSIRKNSQTEEKSLIAVGGWDSSYLSSVEVLDLDLNAWRGGPDLPLAICCAAMVEDPSGGVVLIGGYGYGIGNLDTLYKLPHTGSDATWELMPQKLKTKRERATAFLIPDDIAACN